MNGFDRRDFLKALSAGALAAGQAAAAQNAASQPQPQTARPGANASGSPRRVILIMTDTQRTDMVGCYGNKAMKTPGIDALAARGVRFERAYTCQPVCEPARAALFTGTWPHSNGGWTNSIALGDNIKTVGQRLSDHGIHSAYIGKYHLDGGDYFGLGRCPAGWDKNYWYDMKTYLEELPTADRVRSRMTESNRDGTVTEDFTFGGRCTKRAIDFLEKHGREEFFLVVSYDEPHGPFLCPRPYSEMYQNYEFPKRPNVWDRLEDKPEHQRVWAGAALKQDKDALKIQRPDFFGCNSFIDHEIGRVVETIDKCAPRRAGDLHLGPWRFPRLALARQQGAGDVRRDHAHPVHRPLAGALARGGDLSAPGFAHRRRADRAGGVRDSDAQGAGGQKHAGRPLKIRRRGRARPSSWSSAATRSIMTASAASSRSARFSTAITNW